MSDELKKLKKFHETRLPEIEAYASHMTYEVTKAFRAAMAEIKRLEKENRHHVEAYAESIKHWDFQYEKKSKEIARLRDGLEEAKRRHDSDCAQRVPQNIVPCNCGAGEHNARIKKALVRGEDGT